MTDIWRFCAASRVWATLATNTAFPELLAMNESGSGFWSCGKAAVSATLGSTFGQTALFELGLKVRSNSE